MGARERERGRGGGAGRGRRPRSAGSPDASPAAGPRPRPRRRQGGVRGREHGGPSLRGAWGSPRPEPGRTGADGPSPCLGASAASVSPLTTQEEQSGTGRLAQREDGSCLLRSLPPSAERHCPPSSSSSPAPPRAPSGSPAPLRPEALPSVTSLLHPRAHPESPLHPPPLARPAPSALISVPRQRAAPRGRSAARLLCAARSVLVTTTTSSFASRMRRVRRRAARPGRSRSRGGSGPGTRRTPRAGLLAVKPQRRAPGPGSTDVLKWPCARAQVPARPSPSAPAHAHPDCPSPCGLHSAGKTGRPDLSPYGCPAAKCHGPRLRGFAASPRRGRRVPKRHRKGGAPSDHVPMPSDRARAKRPGP